jgi:hypothetical protein
MVYGQCNGHEIIAQNTAGVKLGLSDRDTSSEHFLRNRETDPTQEASLLLGCYPSLQHPGSGCPNRSLSQNTILSTGAIHCRPPAPNSSWKEAERIITIGVRSATLSIRLSTSTCSLPAAHSSAACLRHRLESSTMQMRFNSCW